MYCLCTPPRLCLNPLICHSRESGNPWAELSLKWFAQRHEGIKRLLRVFVSSCEQKTYRVRKYETMGSRFRGNDNVGILGCVNGCSPRPELVCANTPAASGSISRLYPSVSLARWMLNQVQHDGGGRECTSAASAPLREPLDLSFPRKREPMGRTIGKMVRTKARRHKEVAPYLRVFVRTKIVSRAAI